MCVASGIIDISTFRVKEACSGEYRDDRIMDRAMIDLAAITEIMDGMDKKKLRALNSRHMPPMPKGDTEFSLEIPGCVSKVYSPNNAVEVLAEYEKWVRNGI